MNWRRRTLKFDGSNAKGELIIITRNRVHLLPRALASALQAGTDVEVIVVDDASVDNTGAVCCSFEGIKYIRLEIPQGMGAARNVGILASSARHQLHLLRLPRALASTSEKRQQTRRRALNRIADTLLWNATQAVNEGEYKLACRNALATLRLSPRRALRSKGYRRIGLILRERWRLKSAVQM